MLRGSAFSAVLFCIDNLLPVFLVIRGQACAAANQVLEAAVLQANYVQRLTFVKPALAAF